MDGENEIVDENSYGFQIEEKERTESNKFINLEVSSSYTLNDLNHIPFSLLVTYTFDNGKVV